MLLLKYCTNLEKIYYRYYLFTGDKLAKEG